LYCPFGTGLDDVAGVGFMAYLHSRNLSTARMIWLFLALAIGSGIVVAGRAHSKRLDELDNLHSQGFFNDPY
jgi:hypothetical protein